jgi:CheY-like chemotaxis protein
MSATGHILIVDDDPVLRLVACEMLGQEGYTVREAEDGAVAVRMLQAQPADLVVIDMLMPNKEGLETIQEIKARWPGIRVVAISGGGRGLKSDYLLHMARSLGADAIYEKPLRAAGFMEVVSSTMAADSDSASHAV